MKYTIHLIYKILIGISIFILPGKIFSQTGTLEMATEAVMPPEPMEPYDRQEIYDPNGEYKVLENGKITARGHHKNKIRTGEFIYYENNGSVKKRENYLEGKLHGEYKEYNYGLLKYSREYFKGIKVNYEYEFGYNDTIYMAGPFAKEEQKSGIFTIFSKTVNPIRNGETSSQIVFDTIFLSPNKSATIHHYKFTKKSGITKPEFFIDIDLKKTNVSYSPSFIQALANEMKSYYPSYFPSQENRKSLYYNSSGTLVFKSDSGYTVSYFANGNLKDSIMLLEEGKVARVGYSEAGELLYAVRIDKLSPQKTTNLYYGKNRKLLYEVSAIKDKPDKVKIYSDSIRKKNPKGILTDCFGTAYFYNGSTLAIDSSKTKLEYKYMKKQSLKDGRYFIIPSESMREKRYRVFEIKGNYKNEYTVDSTLIYTGGKGSPIEMYQRDSINYLIRELQNFNYAENGEKYKVLKLLQNNGKLYVVHNRVVNTAVYVREQLLASFDADTLANLKSELLSEKDFKKVLKMKPITKMKKSEFINWLSKCEAINELDDKNQSNLKADEYIYYNSEFTKRLYIYQVYLMGYNPYFSEQEFENLTKSMNLDNAEFKRFRKIFR
ncbi:MAG TPA: hypothetical protein VGF30_09375 [Bacteroidia bacterium]